MTCFTVPGSCSEKCLSNFLNTMAESLQKWVFWRHGPKRAYITPLSYGIHRLNTSFFGVKNVQILSESLFFVEFCYFFTWRLLTAPFQSFDKYSHTQWLVNTWLLCFCLSFRCILFKHRLILRCCVSNVIADCRVNNSGFCI